LGFGYLLVTINFATTLVTDSMGVAKLDALVRRLIDETATAESVFAPLGSDIAAPHLPSHEALHSMYERQCTFIDSHAPVAAWFPGRGGGSTFAAALLAATTLLSDERANVLVVTTSPRAGTALDRAFALLLTHDEIVSVNERLLICESIPAALAEYADAPPYTLAIVDFSTSDASCDALGGERALYEEMCSALADRLVSERIRFVGTPPKAAHDVIDEFVCCNRRRGGSTDAILL